MDGLAPNIAGRMIHTWTDVWTHEQDKEKKEQREQSRLAIRAQKAEWAARNKEAWSKGVRPCSVPGL